MMRGIWTLIAVALAVSATPLAPNQTVLKAKPNDVDILGGDFGLADTPVKVELFNTLSKWMTSSSATGTPEKSTLATLISSYVHKNGYGDSYDGFGGDNLIEWLQSQFAFWMVGTDSGDPNTFICRSMEKESLLSGLFTRLIGVASRPGEVCERDKSGGSGPYQAVYTSDPTLPYRTIYAPLNPPKNVSMPVIVWGGCLAQGVMYANFLTELASHGYIAIATGTSDGFMGGTVVSDMTRNIDWIMNNPAANKYGQIDRTKIIAGGHSCGGLEALSGSYRDPRVSLTMVFNSGVPTAEGRAKMKQLSKPVAYFVGAPRNDFAWWNAEKDFKELPPNVPMLFATLSNSSHLGTMFVSEGGQEAAAAKAFLDWKIKGDESKRSWFCPPGSKPSPKSKVIEKRGVMAASASPLNSKGWNIFSKNGIC